MKISQERSTRAHVSAWLASHYGVISRRQALELGLTSAQINARLRSGAWDVVYRGVYHLAGSPRDLLSDLRAALLVGGPGAAVSHRSAAWLWGITPTSPPSDAASDLDVPTITVPHNRLLRVDGIHVVRSRRPPRPVPRHRLPCTTAVRTLVDCAGQMTRNEFDLLVDTALARRVVPIDALTRITQDRNLQYYPGRRLLAAHLAGRGVAGSPHPSVLESRMARLFVRHGLPQPQAEVVWGPNRRYRLDFAYPGLGLAIEVDGWSAHFAPEQHRYDNRRANALTRAGWTVLHYDWWEVTYDAERVAGEIALTYRQLADRAESR